VGQGKGKEKVRRGKIAGPVKHGPKKEEGAKDGEQDESRGRPKKTGDSVPLEEQNGVDQVIMRNSK